MNSISGIYAISSKCKPEKVYIGSAVNIRRRWRQHKSDLRLKRHGNPRLQRHYNKYGDDDLIFEMIIKCEKQDLISAEQAFIDLYKPRFNICSRAGSALGMRRSAKTRAKVSKAHVGMLGQCHSDETKANMRKAWEDRKPMSNETKERMRKAATKRIASNEAKEARGRAMIGNKRAKTALVINLETGIFYESIKEAATSVNKPRGWLDNRLCGYVRNHTMLRYA